MGACYNKVVEVATRCGYTLSEEQVNSILWNATAFPVTCSLEHNGPMIELFFAANPGAPFEDLMALAGERFDLEARRAIRLAREERKARGIVDP